MVDQPTPEEAIQILHGLRDRYEAHHRVKITDEAIEAAVKLSDRYITDRFLPDKAIDLIDEAGSKVRLNSYTVPPNLKQLESAARGHPQGERRRGAKPGIRKSGRLRDTEQKMREELEATKNEWKEKQGRTDSEVTPEDIAQVVASWTGIPVSKLAEEETERLLKMEDDLASNASSVKMKR